MKMKHRLDAAESVWFERQLESIDTRVYQKQYEQFKARRFVTTQDGLPEDARVYTYRIYDKVGSAKVIANMADDLPTVDSKGEEVSQIIKPLGNSYGWDIFELKTAARLGTNLSDMKAEASRRAIEQLLDELLSIGDADHGIDGLLKLSDTTTYTLSTKDAGGEHWGTLGSENATDDEMVADLMGIASDLVETVKEVWTRFKIVLPLPQYNLAAQTKYGDNADKTVLDFVLANSPYIESIEPWSRCSEAHSKGRMACFPTDPVVASALVPMEYQRLPPQERNLRQVVNAVASCGGVISRYPVAISYADGISEA